MKKICEICRFDRALDRCHIIPQRVTTGLRGNKIRKWGKWGRFENKANIILLCKNHHYLFDIFQLNDEEWQIIMPRILNIRKELIELFNSEIKCDNSAFYKETGKQNNQLQSWTYRLGAILVRFKHLVYYGDPQKLKI